MSLDDPIVNEYDVYLVEDLYRTSTLLQMPLISDECEPPIFTNGKIKSNSNRIELFTYSREGSGLDNLEVNPSHKMVASETSVNHLGVGSFDDSDNSFNLCPISHIYQMRPSFEGFDDRIQRGMKSGPSLSTTKQVGVRKRESDKLLEMRKRSYAYKMHLEDREQFQNISISYSDETTQDSGDTMVEDQDEITP